MSEHIITSSEGECGAHLARLRLTASLVLAGLVLVLAASLKLKDLGVRGHVERWQLLLVTGEASLASWLLSGVGRNAARRVALATFACFTLVSLVKAVAGEESCGCFGSVRVNPWVTASLDALVLLAVLLGGPGPRPLPRRALTALRLTASVGAVAALLIGVANRARPVPLGDVGPSAPQGRVIVLDPEGWRGQRLPVLPYVESHGGGDDDELARGRWILLFYHAGCPRCEEELEVMRQVPVPVTSAPRLAAVEVPESPGAEGVALPDHVKHVRLSSGHEWFVRTPVVVRLDDGVVSHVRHTLLGLITAQDQ